MLIVRKFKTVRHSTQSQFMVIKMTMYHHVFQHLYTILIYERLNKYLNADPNKNYAILEAAITESMNSYIKSRKKME